MFETSLDILQCVKCNNKSLTLEILKKEGNEIEEGFIVCRKCKLKCPIIKKIPILWNDFVSYLTSRPSLGGMFLTRYAETKELRSFIKNSLNKVVKYVEDRHPIEERWVKIYESSKHSRFYNVMRSYIEKLPKPSIVIDHGCSIGLVTNYVSKFSKTTIGIDSSFSAILAAKKTKRKNTEYVVADSISHPFGNQSFDMVIALNILDILEPKDLLSILANQTKKYGFLVLSDPYDFKRGQQSVKEPMNETALRNYLHSKGFKIIFGTKDPSFLKWNLKLNSRANLEYKTDVIIGKKSN